MAKKENKSISAKVTNAAEIAVPKFQVQTTTVSQVSQGPLPSPEVLKHYNEIIPGLAERIVQMAEAETQHRRAMESKIIDSQTSDLKKYRRAELFGQFFGLIIGCSAIFGAIYAATHGAQIAGAFIGTTGVTGLVTAFIVGRASIQKYHDQKPNESQQHEEKAR